MPTHYLNADWPAAQHIHTAITTRYGGVSENPYAEFNLANHVGDNLQHVQQNRQQLQRELHLLNPPYWLNQTHSTDVIIVENSSSQRNADAAITQQLQQACVVLTADCLPILLCNKQGDEVAAIHAGWRGLLNGIIDNTIHKMQTENQNLLAWLGPAIGPEVFEVNQSIRFDFMQQDGQNVNAFKPLTEHSWLADIYQLAKNQLTRLGVNAVFGGDFCTYRDHRNRFYSYRRDNGVTGRLASLIWMTET